MFPKDPKFMTSRRPWWNQNEQPGAILVILLVLISIKTKAYFIGRHYEKKSVSKSDRNRKTREPRKKVAFVLVLSFAFLVLCLLYPCKPKASYVTEAMLVHRNKDMVAILVRSVWLISMKHLHRPSFWKKPLLSTK